MNRTYSLIVVRTRRVEATERKLYSAAFDQSLPHTSRKKLNNIRNSYTFMEMVLSR